MNLEAAKAFAIQKLEKELPSHLSYHSVQHTLNVLEHATVIAKENSISGQELALLQTAALFHDMGFIQDAAGHEKISCDYARQYLPGFDYNEAQVNEVCSMIMATELPQRPATTLAGILCDADLYYLGTDNYAEIAETLFQELNSAGRHLERADWQREQEKFLKAHHYFTKSVTDRLYAKQQKNLETLQADEHEAKAVQHGDFGVGDIILIIVGVLIAGFALMGFLVPNQFFDGGVTGISLLIHELYHFQIAYVIILVNLPLIIMSAYIINIRFALKTFFCIVLLGLCLLYVPYPVITSDKLLVSIFGGFFLGMGIGLTMRAGCAVDGIEVLALYTWRRTSFTISEIVLALNIIIFSLAAFKFGLQTSLYSMLTYFTASKTVDYVVEGIEAYTGVTIISGKSELIKHRLVNELGRGITIYKGERGYLPGKFDVHSDADIIFTVITRLEMRRLKNLVNEVDPKAFVFASTIKEASGGVIKRRHVH
ncbi:YitT family protein [Foetidibacter luteolus]|uniref:YitT family protein n=1 Tax=Foetidibacter luteolus TaxID=2608880 RepID=UPI00129B81D8|nr:YitT family protein [Foetidibacter luteolus]